MNMKLIAGLAVAIALASAMTFVSLASSSKQAPASDLPTTKTSQTVSTGAPQVPAENPVSASSTVTASVKVGGDAVTSTVNVVEE